jgi:AbrB family looped-hinge helix DNA binding protein
METTQLSTKGQIVLPKSIRDAKKWKPGMKFIIEETERGILLRPARPFPSKTVDEVFGCLKYKGKPATLKDMEDAIALGVKRRHALGRY